MQPLYTHGQADRRVRLEQLSEAKLLTIVDGTIVRVLRVCQLAVRQELGAHNSILASLVRRAGGLSEVTSVIACDKRPGNIRWKCCSMPRPLHDENVSKVPSLVHLPALTLDVIVDFLVVGLVLKLNLVGHCTRGTLVGGVNHARRILTNAAGRGRPLDEPVVVARDPLAADVGVDLNMVRVSIVRRGRHGHVAERGGLLHEIGRLENMACKSRSLAANLRISTSTGDRKLIVRSIPPAVITKVLWVEVHCKPSAPPIYKDCASTDRDALLHCVRGRVPRHGRHAEERVAGVVNLDIADPPERLWHISRSSFRTPHPHAAKAYRTGPERGPRAVERRASTLREPGGQVRRTYGERDRRGRERRRRPGGGDVGAAEQRGGARERGPREADHGCGERGPRSRAL
jgi:hypothetical protein